MILDNTGRGYKVQKETLFKLHCSILKQLMLNDEKFLYFITYKAEALLTIHY